MTNVSTTLLEVVSRFEWKTDGQSMPVFVTSLQAFKLIGEFHLHAIGWMTSQSLFANSDWSFVVSFDWSIFAEVESTKFLLCSAANIFTFALWIRLPIS